MDCGIPRFVGPKAKEAYEYLMKKSEEAKANKESIVEKRKKYLDEFKDRIKTTQSIGIESGQYDEPS